MRRAGHTTVALLVGLGLASSADAGPRRKKKRGSPPAAAQPAAPPAEPATPPTPPDTVRVSVVELSGGRAYLEPGAAAGLRAGQDARFAGRAYRILDTTRGHAVVELGDASLAVGARGEVKLGATEATTAVARLTAPAGLESFQHQWRPAPRPADHQTPRPVPLGQAVTTSRVELVLTAHGAGIASRGHKTTASGLLGAHLSATPWSVPLGIDLDVALQGFRVEGGDVRSRPLVDVDQARLRWGERGEPMVALGRLRWAAATVGPIDGTRIAYRRGGLTVAGFGGIVPDPRGGQPASGGAAFGAEVGYELPDVALAPRVTAVAHGTSYDGALDERRLDALIELGTAALGALGHAEISGYDQDNPWGAPRIELSAVGAAVEARRGPLSGSLAFDRRRAERSHRLAALLPPDWLCSREPRTDGSAEPCIADEARTQLVARAGYRRGRLDLAAGAVTTAAGGYDDVATLSGFGLARLGGLPRASRVELGVDGGRVSFLDWIGASLAVGAAVSDGVDLALTYHHTEAQYIASTGGFREDRLSFDALLELPASVELAATLEALHLETGNALAAIATMVWRPLR